MNVTDLEFARRKARSSVMTIALITLVWGAAEFAVAHNVAAAFGFFAASLQTWFVRFLLTREGPNQFLQYFLPPRGGRQ